MRRRQSTLRLWKGTVRSGATTGRRKKTQRPVNFRRYQNTQVQPRHKIFSPLLSAFHEFPHSHCSRHLLGGGISPPRPQIKQKQLAGRLVAVLGFGKKGRCTVRREGKRGASLHEMTLERRTEEINSRAPCSAQAGKTLQHLPVGKASSA